MQRWTPEQEEGDFKMFALGNGTPLRRRRRSSLGLIAKADEYMYRTARSELMFSRLKERKGLLKNTLEKIRELNYNSKGWGRFNKMISGLKFALLWSDLRKWSGREHSTGSGIQFGFSVPRSAAVCVFL